MLVVVSLGEFLNLLLTGMVLVYLVHTR